MLTAFLLLCSSDCSVALGVPTWGTRIRGLSHHSIDKVQPQYCTSGASNLATDYDEQIRVLPVLKNMGARPIAHARNVERAYKFRRRTYRPVIADGLRSTRKRLA